MRNIRWIHCVCWLLLALAPASQAQKAASLAPAAQPKPADVRVLIDVSGSMKQNDPDNLRQPALELLVNLLPEGSKAGVWTFGRYINMLVPHRPVTGSWREGATDKAGEINSLGLFTNIGEALEKAAYDADKPSERYQTSLILLTDGMVDIDKDPEANQREWRRIVDEVLPTLQRAGYTVHTIALSDNADKTLLDKLALGTDGMSEVAKNADELMKIFLRAFDQAAPAEQVPLVGNRFLVDSSIEEFTALIFRAPGSAPTVLVSPDESQYHFDQEQEDVSWYKTETYDLITVKRPIEGEWQALAELEPDSRVTIVSNLKLLVKPLPSNLFLGDTTELSLLLQEQGETITRADFLDLLSVDNQIDHSASDQQWQQSLSEGPAPVDGIYRASLDMFETEGRFELNLTVDGKTFQRQYRHQIAVRKPFVADIEKLVLGGREQYRVSVTAHSQVVRMDDTQVVARIRDPRGRSSIKPLQRTPNDGWELTLQPEYEGTYHVRLRISGTDTTGASFDIDPDALVFQYPDSSPFAEPAAPEPEVAMPEPEPVVAPPVVVAPAPAPPEPERVAEAEPAEKEEASRWPLYVGLGLGNILIMGLAFVAYRMIMGSGKGDSLKELEQAVEDSEELSAVPAEKEAEPQMEEIPKLEVDGQTDTDLAAQLAADMDMGAEGLDLASDAVTEADIPALADGAVEADTADVDAADSEVTDSEVVTPEPSEAALADDLLADFDEDPFADMAMDEASSAGAADAQADDELSDEASIEDALEGFSLDDFSADDLDTLGDEEEPKS